MKHNHRAAPAEKNGMTFALCLMEKQERVVTYDSFRSSLIIHKDKTKEIIANNKCLHI